MNYNENSIKKAFNLDRSDGSDGTSWKFSATFESLRKVIGKGLAGHTNSESACASKTIGRNI